MVVAARLAQGLDQATRAGRCEDDVGYGLHHLKSPIARRSDRIEEMRRPFRFDVDCHGTFARKKGLQLALEPLDGRALPGMCTTEVVGAALEVRAPGGTTCC